ncbi:MAG: SBBP repeat-containing protein [Ignavibacteria bacterium]
MISNFKFLFLLLIILFFFQSFSISQPYPEWIRQYNGTSNGADFVSSIALDNSGNVYVTGNSAGIGSHYDYATIKYDNAGNQLWIARYNGPGNGEDKPVAICLDRNNNVYVTGSSIGSGTNNLDYATIKYNNSGEELWASRYSSGNQDDIAKAMSIDTSGNIYISGYNSVIQTIKYDSSGNQMWIRSYDGPGTGGNFINDITTDQQGNIVLTGSSDLDFLTIKYSINGNQMWVKKYNGPQNNIDYANAIITDTVGNVYVTGKSYKYWATIKYNSSGDQIWIVNNNHWGESNDAANDIIIDDDGNVCVTGTSVNSVKNGSFITTAKYSYNGYVIWEKKAQNRATGIKIVKDLNNNLIVLVKLNIGFVTLKYNPAGILLWFVNYGSSNELPFALAVDNFGNKFVGFSINENMQSSNYGLIKYSETITNIIPTNSISEKFQLKQNYPNPFNPNTVINYQLAVNGFTSLKIYNVLGNEVASLVNEKQNAGSYDVKFDGSNLSSGIYFYKLEIGLPDEVGSFNEIKKMILLK